MRKYLAVNSCRKHAAEPAQPSQPSSPEFVKREDSAIMLQEFLPERQPKEKLGTGTSVSFMCDGYHIEFASPTDAPEESELAE